VTELSRTVNYLIRRVILAVPTLFALSLIIFSTMMMVPLSERMRMYRSDHGYVNPLGPQVSDDVIIAKYHLNESFAVQWIAWLRRTLSGNLGVSISMGGWGGIPVTQGILRSFGATLEIVMFAAPITILLGYKLGVLSGRQAHNRTLHGGIVDKIIRIVTTIEYSTPAFFVGLFLLVVLYIGFHWPSIGRLGLEAELFVSSSEFTSYTGLYTIDALLNRQLWILIDALQHLSLPVLTLILTLYPIVTRVTRASMLDELNKPYILVARAKGLKDTEVVDHAKKPSLFPVFTVSGILVASMLTGVVVVERVFHILGIGYWLVEGAIRWDYSLLVAILLLFCIIFTIANIIVDVAYTRLDPRVKL
jgi:peptide/nickel transport system permease protein